MKRFTFSIVALAVLLISEVATAYIPSPQYGAFELKFGPYRPNVDAEPGLTGEKKPYRTILKNDNMFLTVLELDWQFYHPPGFSLGIGGSVGFMQAYARSTIETEDGGEEDSADYTVLNVIPFALLGIIRIDALADELNVPLVPFVKAGLNWYLWWMLGGGETAQFTDDKGDTEDGVGGTLGWQVSTGLMFRLDQFDPMSARTFDNEVGVNHSYIFVELLWAGVEGLGRDNVLYLSTDTFFDATLLAGLCLEF